MNSTHTAPTAMGASLRKLAGYVKDKTTLAECQAWTAAKWQRAAELRHAKEAERELYRLVKARYRGGLL